MNQNEISDRKVVRMSRPVKLELAATKFGALLNPNENPDALNEYRRIKRPILEYAFAPEAMKGPRSNLLMVTSSLPGEGKTFTAINLALSMAMEVDRTVMLIDADIVDPSVNKELGLGSGPGLTDYLSKGGGDLSEYILKTDIENFSILPAGKKSMRSVELLSSERMLQLADELAERYPDRMIVIDSPPVLATNEAPLLSGIVGQILVVVEAEGTPRSVLKDALSHIKQDKPVNLVLNKTRKKTGNYGYGYRYGG